MNTQDYVQVFEQLSYDDVDTVGGKGASLGEMTQAGARVPRGFVVTTAAFEAYLAAIDPDGEIRTAVTRLQGQDTATIEAAGRALRERIVATPVPEAIREAIVSQWQTLVGGRGDVPMAVRSSATCEDSEGASFAGLQDTYLWTRGADDLLDKIRACWASLYNTESITYRQRLDLEETDIAMAVVVQEMVNAECAGVMFTRSPTTGDRSVIVIEGSWGLGSCIVSGEVTPDRFVVNKVTGEIATREIAAKTVEHVPCSSGSGVVEREVDDARQREPVISDEQLAELWQIARKLEKHYGSPQDIEWAIPTADSDDDRSVCLLQSRPETVWAARESAPAAKPAANAFDHVLGMMGSRKN